MRRVSLELFVTGYSSSSRRARENLRRITSEHLKGRCDVAVIDITQDPGAAAAAQILATPTLIRKAPPPARRVIGDLSDSDRVVELLGLRAGSV
jgi:circadian clock protein KaiB